MTRQGLRLFAPCAVSTRMHTTTLSLKSWPQRQPLAFLVLAAAVWLGLYQMLIPASEALVAALPVDRASHLGGALQFFFYDTPKVLLLLTCIVFVMSIVHTFVSPERTRAMLAGKPLGVTFSFLISASMVNEVALALLFGMFGWKVAALYLGLCLSVAIIAGVVIGKLHKERYLEDWVCRCTPMRRASSRLWKR